MTEIHLHRSISETGIKELISNYHITIFLKIILIIALFSDGEATQILCFQTG